MKRIYRCANGAEVSIILHALAEEGIMAVEGEKGTSSVFPLPNLGPSIYVKEIDSERAKVIILDLEQNAMLSAKNESFKEVDKPEIDYLRDVHQGKKKNNIWWIMVVILFLIALIRSFLKFQNTQETWFS